MRRISKCTKTQNGKTRPKARETWKRGRGLPLASLWCIDLGGKPCWTWTERFKAILCCCQKLRQAGKIKSRWKDIPKKEECKHSFLFPLEPTMKRVPVKSQSRQNNFVGTCMCKNLLTCPKKLVEVASITALLTECRYCLFVYRNNHVQTSFFLRSVRANFCCHVLK